MYVVTEIDKTAWPSGTGIIKAGLHPDKIEEYKNKYGNNWKKIPELAKIVVFPRDHHLISKNKYIVVKSLKKKDLIYINSKKVNISSSLIRKFW